MIRKSAFDRDEVVREVVRDDLVLLRELIEIFLRHCPNVITALEEAITTREDPSSIEVGAHNLKNLVANFRAQRAFELAHELEVSADDPARSAEIWRLLRPEIELLQTGLAELSRDITGNQQ